MPGLRPSGRRLVVATTIGLLATLSLAGLTSGLAPSSATQPTGADASPVSAWTRVTGRSDASLPRTVTPSAYRAYALDRDVLLAELDGPEVVSLPAPDGTSVAFEVTPSTVLAPADAAAQPNLRTWSGRQVDGAATLALEVTSTGVHAAVLGDGSAWYVDPAYRGTADPDARYLSYDGTAVPSAKRELVEPKLDPAVQAQISRSSQPASGAAVAESAASRAAGATTSLHTYRLALLSDPSYAAYVAPGASTHAAADGAVLAAKTVLVDRLNQVYERDLSVHLTLAPDTGTKLDLLSTAEATGADGPCGQQACFDAGQLASCTSGLLERQQWVLGQLLGAPAYDVGHLMLGVNGGGVAYVGVVGQAKKAAGCTGLPRPSGDAYAIDYLAHELGHQFGATHTFDATSAACGGGNRSSATAVEPGSGSTIMAYAGICGDDNLQTHSDPVFAATSRAQVAAQIAKAGTVTAEVQSVALDNFDAGDSLKLVFPNGTSSAITSGSGYTAAGIRSAVIAGCACGVTGVTPFFSTGSLDSRGFTVTYASGTDIPQPAVTTTTGSFTAGVGTVVDGGTARSQGVVTATPNHNPVVTAPAAATIPVQTPFTLSGTAGDVDGDALAYLWEQEDLGDADGQLLTTQPKTSGPLFRVFGTASSSFANVPGSNPTRTFPDLAQVLAGDTNASGSCPAPADVTCLSESLPTPAYSPSALDFRLTALDGQAGGGTDSDTVRLTLDKTAGPFRVTSQAGAATLVGGSAQNVTWDVANTAKASLSPTVDVLLSTDGGRSFPTALALGVANNGSTTVTLPDIDVASARIMVAAASNYFFDVNRAGFAIRASTTPVPATGGSTGPGGGTVPGTTITAGPTGWLLAESSVVSLASDAAGASFVCQVDGVAQSCAQGSLTLSGLTPGGHRVTAAAVAPGGVADPTPATLDFVVPVDDRVLGGHGWRRRSVAAAYERSVSEVARSGATLRYAVHKAKRIALVVDTGPGLGSVQVYLGHHLLKTVKLSGRTRYARTVPLATFPKARSGTVRIVTTSALVVRIDGLGVATFYVPVVPVLPLLPVVVLTPDVQRRRPDGLHPGGVGRGDRDREMAVPCGDVVRARRGGRGVDGPRAAGDLHAGGDDRVGGRAGRRPGGSHGALLVVVAAMRAMGDVLAQRGGDREGATVSR